MSTGDMANGVDHGHHDESPRDAYARERDGAAVNLVHSDGAAAGEYHEICAD